MVIKGKDIKLQVENTTKRINIFFRSEKFRKMMIFLGFLLLAFCFWLLRSFQNDYTQTYEVPLSIINLPPEFVLTDDPPEFIRVTVSAKGNDIFRYNYRKGFMPIEMDVNHFDKANKSFVFSADQLNNEIQKQLLGNTQLQSIYPSYIQISYKKRESKQVPVMINGAIVPASQRMLSGEIQISPAVITAYGAKEVIDTLKNVFTDYFEALDLKDSVEKIVNLPKMKGIQFVPDKITVSIPVEEFTEKIIEIPISALNTPEHLTLKTFPKKVNVSFFVVLSKFNHVTENDFEVTADYIEFEKNKSEEKHPLYLSKFPDFVQNIRINPTEVTILLEGNNSNND